MIFIRQYTSFCTRRAAAIPTGRFGSNLWRYIDYPIERAIPHVVRESVEAIRMWEPRCRLLKVTPSIDGEHLTLRVQWRAADDVINTTEVLWR